MRIGRPLQLRRTLACAAARVRNNLVRYGLALSLVNAVMFLGFSAGALAETRILALGDSLTAGYGLGATEGLTAQLERALKAKGIDAKVLNAGVSGDTTAGGLARVDWALGDKPAAAIVALGANDMLRGFDPAATERNLDKILTKLKAADVPVLLLGMRAAPNMGREYAERFDAIYPALAKRHGVLLYPFFLEGVAAEPALNLPDGIHPNAKGIAAIVQRLTPYVQKLVAAARTAG